MDKLKNLKINLVSILKNIYQNKDFHCTKSKFFKSQKKKIEKKIIKKKFNQLSIKLPSYEGLKNFSVPQNRQLLWSPQETPFPVLKAFSIFDSSKYKDEMA